MTVSARPTKAFVAQAQRDNREPHRSLPKSGPVDSENHRPGQGYDRDRREQNPEHPLGDAGERCRGASLFTINGHSCDDGREDRIKNLVHFPQTASDFDDHAVDADHGKSHAGGAPDKTGQHDHIRADDGRVKQIVGGDGRRVDP